MQSTWFPRHAIEGYSSELLQSRQSSTSASVPHTSQPDSRQSIPLLLPLDENPALARDLHSDRSFHLPQLISPVSSPDSVDPLEREGSEESKVLCPCESAIRKRRWVDEGFLGGRSRVVRDGRGEEGGERGGEGVRGRRSREWLRWTFSRCFEDRTTSSRREGGASEVLYDRTSSPRRARGSEGTHRSQPGALATAVPVFRQLCSTPLGAGTHLLGGLLA